jgi:hypothetical protein
VKFNFTKESISHNVIHPFIENLTLKASVLSSFSITDLKNQTKIFKSDGNRVQVYDLNSSILKSQES